MRTALIVVLLASLAQAADDAPVIGRSLFVHEGETMPFSGQCLDSNELVRREKINERNAAELAKAKESTLVSVPVLVAIIASSIALGLGVGYGVSRAVR